MAPVVALTGATSGVGRVIARRFARDGAQLGLIPRGRDGLDAAGAIEDAQGPIDIWINDAMNQSAHTRSPQLFLTKHRRALSAAATAVATGAAALATRA